MKRHYFFGFKSPKINRGLVTAESVITASVLSIAMMAPFFNSIGMNQGEIALSQMACVAVLMIMNVPMGWVADRFSRKVANVFGDLLCGGVLLVYSQVNSLTGVIACEATFGLACALSQGVDTSLLKHFCKDDPSLFKKAFGRTCALAEVFEVGLMLIAGPIAEVSLRLCIALSSVPFFLGALIAACVGDDSPKLEANHASSPFKDMGAIIAKNFRNPRFRIRSLAFATGREVTHGIIWAFTPMMLSVGVPLKVVTMGWLLNNAMGLIGIHLARRYSRLSYARSYVLPFMAIGIAGSIMFFKLNIVTIWLYGLFGLARGWNSSTLMPMVKELVDDREQATAESAVRVLAQLLYIITIYVINRAADVELRYGLAATLLIFLPLASLVAWQLRRQERQE